jgi:hypothetical protein
VEAQKWLQLLAKTIVAYGLMPSLSVKSIKAIYADKPTLIEAFS